MAGTAAATAASAASGEASGGVGGAVGTGGSKDGQLDSGFFARALWAGDFLLLVNDDFLEARAAVVADIFVNWHCSDPFDCPV
jgi:hypothetical protein